MSNQQHKTQHFTFIAKVKEGRGKNIRANAAKRNEISWEDTDKGLRPLTIHYARWILFDNDTRFIYTATFDTEMDKYLDDAVESLLNRVLQGSFLILRDFLMILPAQVMQMLIENF